MPPTNGDEWPSLPLEKTHLRSSELKMVFVLLWWIEGTFISNLDTRVKVNEISFPTIHLFNDGPYEFEHRTESLHFLWRDAAHVVAICGM